MEQPEIDILQKIKLLEDRIKNLENQLANKPVLHNNAHLMPAKRYDHDGKKQDTRPQPVTKKGEINVTVDNELNVKDEKGNIYGVGEEMAVKNNLVMGDKLLVLIKDEVVETIKVSQRAKRIKEEALVTVKDDLFYAVSKHATHKLINYDVLSRGVLKGFEVKITLPKDFEKNASVVLIDSVENSGGMSAANNDNKIEINQNRIPNSNIRVVENDDLV